MQKGCDLKVGNKEEFKGKSKRKKKKSRRPYRTQTATIGEILAYRASTGDEDAAKILHLLTINSLDNNQKGE